MEKSILEKLREARTDHQLAIVNFFNDGSITTDENYMARQIDSISNWENEYILNVMNDAARGCSRDGDFDTINMGMNIGLIFDINDVDENNNIKEGAKPYKNIVRYYTMNIDSYLDGEKSSTYDHFRYGVNRQGFMRYNDFVRYVKRVGLSFEGPESFEEFKEKILSKEVFDINVIASLGERKDNRGPIRRLK